MKKGGCLGIGLIGLLIAGALMAYNAFNGATLANNQVENAWSKVQSQYQRRADLIPNIVKTVEGVANFEKSTLTAVIEARAKATQVTVDPKNVTPEKLAEFQAAQGQLSQALGRLMVVSEQYPQLKANENFKQLQTTLEGTENDIAAERNKFNDVVLAYNNKVTTFPANLFAKLFGFAKKDGFKSEPGSEKAPEVNINIK